MPIWVFEGTFILCYNVRTGKVQPFAYDHTENLTSLNQGHPSSTVSLLWLENVLVRAAGTFAFSLVSPPKCTLGKGMKHLLHIILSENPSSFCDLKDNNGRCVLLGNLTWTGCWHSCFWFIQKATVDDEEKDRENDTDKNNIWLSSYLVLLPLRRSVWCTKSGYSYKNRAAIPPQ